MYYLAHFSNYTNSSLREKLKQKIKAGTKGGKAGQWSARKAQLLAKEYEKAGGRYKKGKTKNQKSLSKWTKQKWQYSSKNSKGKGKYLPKKAWENMSSEEKKRLNQSKYKANKKGKQFSKAPKDLSKKASKYWKK